MTREEILAMTAGPELDALIETNVFGGTVVGTAGCYDPEGGGWLIAKDASEMDGGYELRPIVIGAYGCRCHDLRDSIRERFPSAGNHFRICLAAVPDYSTNIADAWQVVEKVGLARNWAVTYSNSACSGVGWFIVDNGEYDFLSLSGPASESAPLAICRAALLGVRES